MLKRVNADVVSFHSILYRSVNTEYQKKKKKKQI